MNKEDVLRAFYSWCLRQAQQEVDSDFARVRKVKSEAVRRFFRITEGIPRGDVVAQMHSMIRCRLASSLCLIGEPPTSDDLQVHDRWVRAFREASWGRSNQLRNHDHGSRASDPARGRAAVHQLLSTLPGVSKQISSREWRCDQTLGKLGIQTYVGFGMDRRSLFYAHDVLSNTGEILIMQISFLQWIGVAGGTEWEICEDSDWDVACVQVHELSCLFVEFLTRLV